MQVNSNRIKVSCCLECFLRHLVVHYDVQEAGLNGPLAWSTRGGLMFLPPHGWGGVIYSYRLLRVKCSSSFDHSLSPAQFTLVVLLWLPVLGLIGCCDWLPWTSYWWYTDATWMTQQWCTAIRTLPMDNRLYQCFHGFWGVTGKGTASTVLPGRLGACWLSGIARTGLGYGWTSHWHLCDVDKYNWAAS